MPLKTFYNLPKERQDEILNVCFEEFAINDYKSASLSAIIKKLEIAKGSFYRYFENKQDLYVYLLKFSNELRKSFLDKYLKDSNLNFFEAWINYFIATIRIEEDYPMCLPFLFKAAAERSKKKLDSFNFKSNKDKHNNIKEVLKLHQQRGNIRADINADILAYYIIHLQSAAFDYLTTKYKSDDNSNLESNHSFFSMSDEQLRNDLGEFVKLMREGVE